MAHEGKQAVILDSLRKFMRRGAVGHVINMLRKVRPADFAGLYPRLNDREQLSLLEEYFQSLEYFGIHRGWIQNKANS